MRKLYMLYFAMEQRVFTEGISKEHITRRSWVQLSYMAERKVTGVLWCLRGGVIKGIVGNGKGG